MPEESTLGVLVSMLVDPPLKAELGASVVFFMGPMLEVTENVPNESALVAKIDNPLETGEFGASVVIRLGPLLELSGNVPDESTLGTFVTKLLFTSRETEFGESVCWGCGG